MMPSQIKSLYSAQIKLSIKFPNGYDFKLIRTFLMSSNHGHIIDILYEDMDR